MALGLAGGADIVPVRSVPMEKRTKELLAVVWTRKKGQASQTNFQKSYKR
jgi:hypothetical protein